MNVYIVRHGQTEWNKLMRWQGNKDIPLNETGIEQSKQISEKLLNYNISRIYSSPLIRAYETARIIQKKIHIEIVLLDALKEISIGEWEGLTLKEMEQCYGDLYKEWNINEAAHVGFGIENYKSLQNRAFAALSEICSTEYNAVLLVTHGTWIRALMCKLLHIPLCYRNFFEIDNTGINVIEYDKNNCSFKVITLNAL